MLGERDRERLARILALAPTCGDEGLVSEGVGLVRRSGAIRACHREASEMLERGWGAFSPHVPPSDAKVPAAGVLQEDDPLLNDQAAVGGRPGRTPSYRSLVAVLTPADRDPAGAL